MDTFFTNEPVAFVLEVSEMQTTEDISQVVKLDRVRVQEIIDDYGDEKPQFPILRVEAGLSENGNNWPTSLLRDIAEQINRDEKPGFWGHIPPDQRGFAFPDVETLWLGATVKTEGGKEVLYVKGYNPPDSRARRHRRMARVTSWAGKASGKVVNGVRNIERFALESIDWARPGANGMNARVVAWASEMEGSESEVTTGVDLAKLTLDELRAANPSLFTLMKQEVEREQQTAVQEMKEKADKADEAESVFSKLRKVLGIGEDKDVVEAVSEVVTKVEDISKGELKNRIAAVLTKKLGDKDHAKRAQSAIMRLIPVAEMADKTDDEIEKHVEEFLSSDDDAKAIVTEMVQAPAPLARHRIETGSGSGREVGRSGMVKTGKTKL
jgi:hypothetical protein